MVGTTLRQQLDNFIRFMHEQGVLDQHFDHLRVLQTEENPGFVVEVILMYMNDAQNAIAEIDSSLLEPSVDYDKLIGAVHKLRGASGNIGGCRVAHVCRELRHACDEQDKESCLQTFQRVKEEYQLLQENLNHISAMERSIMTYETSKRGGK